MSSSGGRRVEEGRAAGAENVPNALVRASRLAEVTSASTSASRIEATAVKVWKECFWSEVSPVPEADGKDVCQAGIVQDDQAICNPLPVIVEEVDAPINCFSSSPAKTSNAIGTSSVPDCKTVGVDVVRRFAASYHDLAQFTTSRVTKVIDLPAMGSVRPEPRHEHRAVSCGPLMIVFGGGPCEEDNKGKVHVFDTSKDVWFQPKLSGDIPCERTSFGMAVDVDGNRILIHGGCLREGISDDLYQLNISNWEWKKLNPLTLAWRKPPLARRGHSFTIIEDKIYLFGGLAQDSCYNGSPSLMNDLHILQLHVRRGNEEGIWTQLGTFGKSPSHRQSHTAVAYTSAIGVKKLIIFGGSGVGGGQLGDVNILNLISSTWSKLAPRGMAPPPLSLHSATMVGDRMYVFGGLSSWIEEVNGEMKEQWSCSNSLAYLNVETLTWEHPDRNNKRLAENVSPPPRAAHSAVLIGNKIYIFSGRDCVNQIDGRQVSFPDLWQIEVIAPDTFFEVMEDTDQLPSEVTPAPAIEESVTGFVRSPPIAVTPPPRARYSPVTSPVTPPTPNSNEYAAALLPQSYWPPLMGNAYQAVSSSAPPTVTSGLASSSSVPHTLASSSRLLSPAEAESEKQLTAYKAPSRDENAASKMGTRRARLQMLKQATGALGALYAEFLTGMPRSYRATTPRIFRRGHYRLHRLSRDSFAPQSVLVQDQLQTNNPVQESVIKFAEVQHTNPDDGQPS